MSNQLHDLLSRWQPKQTELEWVLGTIIHTEGSSYRKAGAMLLINSLGQYDGLLSGGCLESDIMRQAKQVMQTGKPKIITYDMQEEDDIGWKLGIGCGGLVEILLQPVNSDNHYQSLNQLHNALSARANCYYIIDTHNVDNNRVITSEHEVQQHLSQRIQKPLEINFNKRQQLIDKRYLLLQQQPKPHLAVLGGGVDARPLVAIASQLGWQVSLIDHRIGYARKEYFQTANTIYRQPFEQLAKLPWLQQIDAAVLMGHNVTFDAKALNLLQNSSAQYLGLLGPSHRKEKVFKAAGLKHSKVAVAGPIGLNLGGELPESIALSILAEIHAFFQQSDARSLSNMLTLGQASIKQQSGVA